MGRVALALLAFGVGIMLIIFSIQPVTAQSGDIAPYLFATTEAGSKVYKTVHQGCELFIVEGDRGHNSDHVFNYNATDVAIAAGRGCR